MAEFKLSIAPTYVAKWGFWEGVRELLQNAIDQHQKNPESEMIIEHNAGENVVRIGTTKSCLSKQTLLLGITDKASDNSYIGQFGEGYKLALLALARAGHSVRILNNDEVWEAVFEYSEEYETTVLQVNTHPNLRDPFDGVMFEIGNVSSIKWLEEVSGRFIPDAEPNSVLPELYNGQIFVGGLYVCTIEGLERGYNFSPDRLRLDRDRMTVATFDITWETSKIWARNNHVGNGSSLHNEYVYHSLESDRADTRYLDNHIYNDDDKQSIADIYKRKHGDAVPVSTQEEIEAVTRKGRKFHLVPETLKKLICKFFDTAIEPAKTPHEILEEFYRNRGNELTDTGRQAFEDILKLSKGWR